MSADDADNDEPVMSQCEWVSECVSAVMESIVSEERETWVRCLCEGESENK